MDEYQRQKDLRDSKYDRYHEKVLEISKSEKLHCHFCKKSNHKMADCIKLKQYKQFQEFSEIRDKEKDTVEKANEIEEDEYVLCVTEGSRKNMKSTVKLKRNFKNSDKEKIFNDSFSTIEQKILKWRLGSLN